MAESSLALNAPAMKMDFLWQLYTIACGMHAS
jgi:hypothetical protein